MSYFSQPRRHLISIVFVPLVIGGMGAFIWATTIQAAHCGAGQGPCTEDVFNTKHNLAANKDIQATGTTEVCVFCHTPHGGQQQQTGQTGGAPAPLWNRALPNASGWTMYNSPNTDVAPGGAPLGVSLACLSCHDGTIALDALINAPGSGGFNSNNRGNLASGGGIPGIKFEGPGVQSPGGDTADAGVMKFDANGRPLQGLDADGHPFSGGLDDFVFPAGGTSGGMNPFPNLTRDLSDDHPISIRMPVTDPQFQDAVDSPLPTSGNRTIRPIFRDNVKDGPQILPTDRRDQIRLYNTPGLAETTIDAVECASCHNPHTPRTTFLRLPSITDLQEGPADGSETPAYTTGVPVPNRDHDLNHEPNQGSLICLTCHQK